MLSVFSFIFSPKRDFSPLKCQKDDIYVCDVFEKEEEEREREREVERERWFFVFSIQSGDFSRRYIYVCVRCLSVSSDVMAAKGDFRFFFFQFLHTKIHRLLSKQKLTICYNKTLLSSSSF
jgi:hypothetical protein